MSRKYLRPLLYLLPILLVAGLFVEEWNQPVRVNERNDSLCPVYRSRGTPERVASAMEGVFIAAALIALGEGLAFIISDMRKERT